MIITATTKQLKIALRKPGRVYNDLRGNAEAGDYDDGVNTSHPFDEVFVEPGQVYTLPAGAELVFVKEMGVGPAASSAPSYVG